MSAARYRQAVRILEQWPKDPSKGEHRDIGVLLRKRIGESFKKGEQSEISDPEKCDKMLTSLENICMDKYQKQYSTSLPLKVGALMNDFEVCHAAVSEEGFQYFKDEESKGAVIRVYESDGTIKRVYNKFFGAKSEESEEKKITT